MVGELIRLRRAIQRHTLSWKRLLGLVAGVLGAVATWAAALFAAPEARADVLSLVLALWLAGWVVGPILTSGASVLRPEYFTLLPLERRALGRGLLATVYVGVGAGVTAAAALAVTGYAAAVAEGPRAIAAVAVGLVSAAALPVLIVALSRAVYALLGAAMRTWLGVEIAAIQYGALFSALFTGWLIVSPLVSSVPAFLARGFADLPAAGAVVRALPTGWPVLAVDAVVEGRLGTAFGLLAALALAALLAVAAASALLVPYVGNRTARRRRRPLGSRAFAGILPVTPFGAVVGKELRTWFRDPWRSLEVRSSIWFGLFVAMFAALGGQTTLVAFAGVAVALMIAMGGANLYGQDGTALWQLVVAESPAAVRADVRGRQVAVVLAMGTPAVVLSALLIALTGAWSLVLPVGSVLVALLGIGSGLSVLLSVLGATPGVDPHRRVSATDAGENGLTIQIGLWGQLLLAAAPVGMAVLLVVGDPPAWFGAATLLVAVLVGGGAAFGLGHLAVRRLGSHLPETFARLRYPGVRTTTESGGDLLDTFSRSAEESAMAARR